VQRFYGVLRVLGFSRCWFCGWLALVLAVLQVRTERGAEPAHARPEGRAYTNRGPGAGSLSKAVSLQPSAEAVLQPEA